MYRILGVVLFLIGGVGLMVQKMWKQYQHTRALQEMNQSLIRIHNAVALRHMPVGQALRQEQQMCPLWLFPYYEQICRELGQHQKSRIQPLLREAEEQHLLPHMTKEESRVWTDSLCALFNVHSPGDDRGFMAYYRQFDEIQKQDYMTKKERQKVTACTMGTGLMMLLLLLL